MYCSLPRFHNNHTHADSIEFGHTHKHTLFANYKLLSVYVEFICLASRTHSGRAEGWGKIDFTWSIRNWIKYENLYHTIDISCNTCEKHPTLDLFSLDYGYRPFIVVNTTSSQTIKRQRRSINCSPGISECCRDKLYISFAEIGWNDWILHPAGYDAYFCRGSCASAATITSDASNYHIFVRVSFSTHEFIRSRFFSTCV